MAGALVLKKEVLIFTLEMFTFMCRMHSAVSLANENLILAHPYSCERPSTVALAVGVAVCCSPGVYLGRGSPAQTGTFLDIPV
jgi:hypothetical protein